MRDFDGVANRQPSQRRRQQGARRNGGVELTARFIHERAWTKAVGTAPCGQRPFLFDFRVIAGSRLFLHVRPRGEEAPFSAGRMARIVVRLSAIRRRDGVEIPVPAEELGRWMAERFAHHGFRLDSITNLTPERIPFGPAGDTRRYINTVIVRATVTVVDFAAASNAWANGIGRDRAWGCGTLLLDML